jgi:hypothetical protein
VELANLAHNLLAGVGAGIRRWLILLLDNQAADRRVSSVRELNPRNGRVSPCCLGRMTMTWWGTRALSGKTAASRLAQPKSRPAASLGGDRVGLYPCLALARFEGSLAMRDNP